MHRSKLAVLITTLLALTTPSLHAHHAFAAEYDDTKIVSITGTVTDLQWTNPHAWLIVHGLDDRGNTTTWRFEMGAPGGLLRRGWTKGELKKGDHVTVDGFCAKSGKTVANARNVTLPDGRKLFGGFASTPGAPPNSAASN